MPAYDIGMTLADPQNPLDSGETAFPAAANDDPVETHVRAARAAFDVENYDGAIAACERLLTIRPNAPEALLLLGLVSWKLDEPVQAVDLLRRAQDADPDTREYADALATILAQLGDSTESLYYAKLATILAPHPLGTTLLPPKFAEYFLNLNFARPHTFRNRARKALDRGAVDEAIELCSTQLELTPNEPDTLRLIAAALFEKGQLTSAVSALQTVIRDCATAGDYEQLARILTVAGRFDEALLAHDMVGRRQPGDPSPALARLRTLARQDGDAALQTPYAIASRAWFETHATRGSDAPAFENPADPSRRLRIGYVGAGLHAGELAPMLEPIFARHDREAVEVYVYSDDERQDPMTESLMRHAARWTDLRNVDAETAAEIMRGDGIDIAVDLRGHGQGNRLLTMYRRPAPVCLGWLGIRPAVEDAYDAHLLSGDSGGEGFLPADHPITIIGAPATNPAPPQAGNGHTTFGVLGPISAIGHASVAIWKTALEAVPGSEILVANHARVDSETSDRIYKLAAHVGLHDRVTIAELEDPHAPRTKFMDYIDVVLDTMPDSGFAEIGEALWMGVPALAAQGSAGARALAAAGKHEWIYNDLDALETSARMLADDTEQLHVLRREMRLSIADAPLFHAERFTRNLEAALRTHWVRWCDRQADA